MTNTRIKSGMIAMGLAVAVLAATLLLPADSRLALIFFDRASTIYPFTVQNAMWVFFFLGLGELAARMGSIRENSRILGAGYLSERPDVFYDHSDLAEIRKKTHGKKDMLAVLINILITRYQISNRAVDETHQMLNSQLELMNMRLDTDYSLIRFITWLLPSLGFIGTVMGISETLNKAGMPGASDQPDFLHTLTSSLGFAFDTTLVALLMSAVLVYLMHLAQTLEERSLGRCGMYCLDNLINKLISRYDGKA